MRGNTTRILIGVAFVLSAIALAAYGTSRVVEQDHLIRAAVPAEATVRSVTIENHTTTGSGRYSSTSTSYRPKVTFDYTVDGRAFTSSTVTPVETWGAHDWAAAVAARFPAGSRATAYYDPASPARAFLLPEYQFSPYLLAIFPLAHLCAGLAALVGPRLGMTRTLSLVLLVWTAAGAACFGHYFARVGAAATTPSRVALGIYAGLGSLALLLWIASLRRERRRQMTDLRLP
jgi:hypothetical protein